MVALILIAAFVFQLDITQLDSRNNWTAITFIRTATILPPHADRVRAARLGSPTDLDEMLEIRRRPAGAYAGHPARGVLRHTGRAAGRAGRRIQTGARQQPPGQTDQPGSLRAGSRASLRRRSGKRAGCGTGCRARPSLHLFFERTRNMLDVVSHHWPVSVRRTIAELDLTYYHAVLGRCRPDDRLLGREPHRRSSDFPARATT